MQHGGYSPQISPGLNANEIQIPYNKHHKVSSLTAAHELVFNWIAGSSHVIYCNRSSAFRVG